MEGTLNDVCECVSNRSDVVSDYARQPDLDEGQICNLKKYNTILLLPGDHPHNKNKKHAVKMNTPQKQHGKIINWNMNGHIGKKLCSIKKPMTASYKNKQIILKTKNSFLVDQVTNALCIAMSNGIRLKECLQQNVCHSKPSFYIRQCSGDDTARNQDLSEENREPECSCSKQPTAISHSREPVDTVSCEEQETIKGQYCVRHKEVQRENHSPESKIYCQNEINNTDPPNRPGNYLVYNEEALGKYNRKSQSKANDYCDSQTCNNEKVSKVQKQQRKSKPPQQHNTVKRDDNDPNKARGALPFPDRSNRAGNFLNYNEDSFNTESKGYEKKKHCNEESRGQYSKQKHENELRKQQTYGCSCQVKTSKPQANKNSNHGSSQNTVSGSKHIDCDGNEYCNKAQFRKETTCMCQFKPQHYCKPDSCQNARPKLQNKECYPPCHPSDPYQSLSSAGPSTKLVDYCTHNGNQNQKSKLNSEQNPNTSVSPTESKFSGSHRHHGENGQTCNNRYTKPKPIPNCSCKTATYEGQYQEQKQNNIENGNQNTNKQSDFYCNDGRQQQYQYNESQHQGNNNRNRNTEPNKHSYCGSNRKQKSDDSPQLHKSSKHHSCQCQHKEDNQHKRQQKNQSKQHFDENNSRGALPFPDRPNRPGNFLDYNGNGAPPNEYREKSNSDRFCNENCRRIHQEQAKRHEQSKNTKKKSTNQNTSNKQDSCNRATHQQHGNNTCVHGRPKRQCQEHTPKKAEDRNRPKQNQKKHDTNEDNLRGCLPFPDRPNRPGNFLVYNDAPLGTDAQRNRKDTKGHSSDRCMCGTQNQSHHSLYGPCECDCYPQHKNPNKDKSLCECANENNQSPIRSQVQSRECTLENSPNYVACNNQCSFTVSEGDKSSEVNQSEYIYRCDCCGTSLTQDKSKERDYNEDSQICACSSENKPISNVNSHDSESQHKQSRYEKCECGGKYQNFDQCECKEKTYLNDSQTYNDCECLEISQNHQNQNSDICECDNQSNRSQHYTNCECDESSEDNQQKADTYDDENSIDCMCENVSRNSVSQNDGICECGSEHNGTLENSEDCVCGGRGKGSSLKSEKYSGNNSDICNCDDDNKNNRIKNDDRQQNTENTENCECDRSNQENLQKQEKYDGNNYQNGYQNFADCYCDGSSIQENHQNNEIENENKANEGKNFDNCICENNKQHANADFKSLNANDFCSHTSSLNTQQHRSQRNSNENPSKKFHQSMQNASCACSVCSPTNDLQKPIPDQQQRVSQQSKQDNLCDSCRRRSDTGSRRETSTDQNIENRNPHQNSRNLFNRPKNCICHLLHNIAPKPDRLTQQFITTSKKRNSQNRTKQGYNSPCFCRGVSVTSSKKSSQYVCRQPSRKPSWLCMCKYSKSRNSPQTHQQQQQRLQGQSNTVKGCQCISGNNDFPENYRNSVHHRNKSKNLSSCKCMQPQENSLQLSELKADEFCDNNNYNGEGQFGKDSENDSQAPCNCNCLCENLQKENEETPQSTRTSIDSTHSKSNQSLRISKKEQKYCCDCSSGIEKRDSIKSDQLSKRELRSSEMDERALEKNEIGKTLPQSSRRESRDDKSKGGDHYNKRECCYCSSNIEQQERQDQLSQGEHNTSANNKRELENNEIIKTSPRLSRCEFRDDKSSKEHESCYCSSDIEMQDEVLEGEQRTSKTNKRELKNNETVKTSPGLSRRESKDDKPRSGNQYIEEGSCYCSSNIEKQEVRTSQINKRKLENNENVETSQRLSRRGSRNDKSKSDSPCYCSSNIESQDQLSGGEQRTSKTNKRELKNNETVKTSPRLSRRESKDNRPRSGDQYNEEGSCYCSSNIEEKELRTSQTNKKKLKNNEIVETSPRLSTRGSRDEGACFCTSSDTLTKRPDMKDDYSDEDSAEHSGNENVPNQSLLSKKEDNYYINNSGCMNSTCQANNQQELNDLEQENNESDNEDETLQLRTDDFCDKDCECKKTNKKKTKNENKISKNERNINEKGSVENMPLIEENKNDKSCKCEGNQESNEDKLAPNTFNGKTNQNDEFNNLDNDELHSDETENEDETPLLSGKDFCDNKCSCKTNNNLEKVVDSPRNSSSKPKTNNKDEYEKNKDGNRASNDNNVSTNFEKNDETEKEDETPLLSGKDFCDNKCSCKTNNKQDERNKQEKVFDSSTKSSHKPKSNKEDEYEKKDGNRPSNGDNNSTNFDNQLADQKDNSKIGGSCNKKCVGLRNKEGNENKLSSKTSNDPNGENDFCGKKKCKRKPNVHNEISKNNAQLSKNEEDLCMDCTMQNDKLESKRRSKSKNENKSNKVSNTSSLEACDNHNMQNCDDEYLNKKSEKKRLNSQEYEQNSKHICKKRRAEGEPKCDSNENLELQNVKKSSKKESKTKIVCTNTKDLKPLSVEKSKEQNAQRIKKGSKSSDYNRDMKDEKYETAERHRNNSRLKTKRAPFEENSKANSSEKSERHRPDVSTKKSLHKSDRRKKEIDNCRCEESLSREKSIESGAIQKADHKTRRHSSIDDGDKNGKRREKGPSTEEKLKKKANDDLCECSQSLQRKSHKSDRQSRESKGKKHDKHKFENSGSSESDHKLKGSDFCSKKSKTGEDNCKCQNNLNNISKSNSSTRDIGVSSKRRKRSKTANEQDKNDYINSDAKKSGSSNSMPKYVGCKLRKADKSSSSYNTKPHKSSRGKRNSKTISDEECDCRSTSASRNSKNQEANGFDGYCSRQRAKSGGCFNFMRSSRSDIKYDPKLISLKSLQNSKQPIDNQYKVNLHLHRSASCENTTHGEHFTPKFQDVEESHKEHNVRKSNHSTDRRRRKAGEEKHNESIMKRYYNIKKNVQENKQIHEKCYDTGRITTAGIQNLTSRGNVKHENLVDRIYTESVVKERMDRKTSLQGFTNEYSIDRKCEKFVKEAIMSPKFPVKNIQ